jgi:DNA polymerase-3 subunit delta
MFLLFHGSDDFSAREELAGLRAAPEFGPSQDIFVGAAGNLEAIRQAGETLPFLSERRLVIVEGLPKRKRAAKGGEYDSGGGGDEEVGDAATPAVQKATSKGKRGSRASNAPDPRAFAEGLAECAARLPETTTLVALVEEPLEPAHVLVRAAEQYGKVRLFTPPRGAQLEEWLVRRAAARDAHLAREAARLLATEAGDDLRLLAHEIDKLSTYAGTGGQIGVEAVRALTPVAHQARVFDLTDALARRDRPRALTLLHELLVAGESPLGIVALTAYSTRSLLQVKSLSERGLRPHQIAQTAGIAPFQVEKSLRLARQFSFAQLESAHRSLLSIDTALKSSRMTPELALDLLVIEFGTQQ